jgi:hypothetical protein
MGRIGEKVKREWTPSQLSQEGGRIPVVSDNVTEGVTDLSVSELLREIQANQHGTIQIGRGLILLRGRGAKDFVSHAVIIGTGSANLGGRVDSASTVHPRLRFSIRKSN